MKKALDILSSRIVSIYLFLILLFVSLLGAFIPQKELPAFYEAQYQPWAVKLFHMFQLTDIYRSWYFIFLLLFLVASLTTCTLRRLPRALRVFGAGRARIPAKPEDLACRAEVGDAGDAAAAEDAARKLGFRWRRAEKGILYGRRRPYAVLGEILTHTGLVIIFVAGFLRLLGIRETVFVFEGQGVALPASYGEGYELLADKVEQTVDGNTGRVLEFRTATRLFLNGEEVAARDVEVNGPLRYRGLGIYQSNMDVSGSRGLALETVKLREGETAADVGAATFAWTVGDNNGDVTINVGETKPLGDTGFRIRYLEYYERFFTDENGYHDTNPEYNPAAFINVINAEGAAAMGIVFQLYPEFTVLRKPDEKFSRQEITIAFAEETAKGPQTRRREYIFAPGNDLFVGGARERLSLSLPEGEGPSLNARPLAGVLSRADGRRETLNFPLGEAVPVKLADGDYVFRFKGSRRAALTGLTVARDPGVAAFYIGCLLLSLGVVAALLLRFDELFVFTHAGKVFLAGRSNKGISLFRPAFDAWVAKVKERIKRV